MARAIAGDHLLRIRPRPGDAVLVRTSTRVESTALARCEGTTDVATIDQLLGRFRLRTKFAVMLAVPLIALIGFSVMQIRSSAGTVSDTTLRTL